MSISAQNVKASVSVGSSKFRVKNVKIDRKIGRSIGKATVKGVIDDPENISFGDEVSVYMTTDASDNVAQQENLETYGTLFVGEAHSAKQNEEGIVTVEAFDAFEKLQTKSVQLETEEPKYPDRVAEKLLEEVYAGVARQYGDAGTNTPYIALPDKFVPEISASIYRFGNAKRGEPLINVLQKLVDALGAHMWVDRYGILRIEPYPEHDEWQTPLIKSLNAGEETRKTGRVIFEATGADSELGPAASYVSSQFSHTSESRIGPGKDEPPAPEKVLTDPNVSTQREADQRSYRKGVEEDQKKDYGKVQIIGNAEIDLHDEIFIPELEFSGTGFGGLLAEPLYEESQFRITGIVHKIDSTDGFLTTMQLSPAFEDTLGDVVNSAVDIKQDYIDQFKSSKKGTKVSGQDDVSGFLGTLFGTGL